MEKDKLKKIIKTATEIDKLGSFAIAQEFSNVSDKIDKVGNSVETIKAELSEELKKKLDEELVYEVDEEKIVSSVLEKIPTPKNGKHGAKGKDGKNYVLTEIDKLEIAEKIEVPVVEKVIEKTETIIEKPIEKDVSGEYIVDKINELPTSSDDYKIDAKHIKNLPKIVEEVGRGWGGGSQSSQSVNLSGYVPYTGATQDLNLGHFYLESDGIKAHDSAGGFIKSNNGTTIAQYGAGGGANWTFADGVNYTSATADTLAYFNGSKTLSSVTNGTGVSLSGGVLSVTGLLPTYFAINSINALTMSSDVKDWDTETNSIVYVTPESGGYILSGVVSPTQTTSYPFLFISNISEVNNFIISHNDSNSVTENRFYLPGATSITINPFEGAIFNYDNDTKVWRFLAKTGGLVNDGDYGDVTVSGSGTVMTVDNVSSTAISGQIQPANHNYGIVYAQICGY